MSINVGKAHAVATLDTYKSALNRWFQFCDAAGFPALLRRECIPDALEAELLIMLYAQHLFDGGLDAKSTIRGYVAAVRDFHVQRLGFVPWEPALRLKLLLKSLRRLDVRRVHKRAAVTLHILRLWRPFFDLGKRQHLVWWTSMMVAFMGLFRKSEFTTKVWNLFNAARNLCRADASFQLHSPDGAVFSMELHVKFYKNEQFGSSTAVPFRWVGGDFCPVDLVQRVLAAFAHLPPTAPLFPGGAGFSGALSASEFTSLIARLVAATPQLVGVKLLPHSFRIGGAMALFEAGAPDSVIQMMGRWRSDAFLVYLRSSRHIILHWNQMVASGARSPSSRVLGIDQVEASLASLRLVQDFDCVESSAASPALGVVSGRSATSRTTLAAGPAPSLFSPLLSPPI
jgi:hypothetical protein